MRIYIFLLLSLITVKFAISQNNNLFDSLYYRGTDKASRDINITKEALSKINEINNLSKIQIVKVNYLKFLIEIYKKKKYNKQSNIATIKINELKNADSIFTKGVKLIHNSYPDLGLPLLFKFLEIAKKDAIPVNKQYLCKINIAEGYRKKREFKKGIDILYSIIYSKDISEKNLAYAYSRLSANYSERKDGEFKWRIDSVIKYSELSVKISRENSYILNLASSLNELGYVYSNRFFKYNLAEKYLIEAYNYFIEYKAYKNAINTSINLANLYLRTGHYKKALKVAEKAIDICDVEGNGDVHMRLYLELADIYNYNKMYYEAYTILSIGRKMQVALEHNINDRTINELAAKYDLKIKEEQIKQEKLKLKTERKQRLYVYAILSSIIIILIISSILIVLKNKNILQQKKLVDIEKEHLKEISELKNKDLLQAIAKKISYDKILLQIKEALKNNNKREIINIVNQNINTENEWDKFLVKFTELHPDFFAKLEKQLPNLTKSEKRLSSLLFMNFKSKNIANVLNISENSVNKSRQRLRKKLNLPHEANISIYIKNIIQ